VDHGGVEPRVLGVGDHPDDGTPILAEPHEPLEHVIGPGDPLADGVALAEVRPGHRLVDDYDLLRVLQIGRRELATPEDIDPHGVEVAG